MGEIFNTILFEPLFNALIGLYHILPFKDLGVAIILLTIAIKLLLYSPTQASIKAQKSMQEMQPKLEELKKKYGNDKEELGRQLMNFYKVHKVNPLSSCLPLLIQLPILIALYRVFFGGLSTDPATGVLAANQVEHLYDGLQTIYATTPIHTIFLGIVDLAKSGNVVLAVLAGGAQFFQSRMMMRRRPPVASKGAKDEDMTARINQQMMYFLPIITVIFGYQFPSGLTLYWLATTLFMILQQWLAFRHTNVASDTDTTPPSVSASSPTTS